MAVIDGIEDGDDGILTVCGFLGNLDIAVLFGLVILIGEHAFLYISAGDQPLVNALGKVDINNLFKAVGVFNNLVLELQFYASLPPSPFKYLAISLSNGEM